MSQNLLAGAPDLFEPSSVICPTCQKETERHPRHVCGSATMQVRGWSWLGNDGVNLAASPVGACVAAGLWILSG